MVSFESHLRYVFLILGMTPVGPLKKNHDFIFQGHGQKTWKAKDIRLCFLLLSASALGNTLASVRKRRTHPWSHPHDLTSGCFLFDVSFNRPDLLTESYIYIYICIYMYMFIIIYLFDIISSNLSTYSNYMIYIYIYIYISCLSCVYTCIHAIHMYVIQLWGLGISPSPGKRWGCMSVDSHG